MGLVDTIRRKRQRTEDPAVPVVPRPAPTVDIVDVEEIETPVIEPAGVPSPPPTTEAAGAENVGKGKEPLGPGCVPLVIVPEPPTSGEEYEEYQRFLKYRDARLLEGEENKRVIHEYFLDDTPSSDAPETSRADLEPFFRGQVGEKVVPLLAELAQGMLSSMSEIPLRSLARDGTDNEVSLISAARLSSLRVSFVTTFSYFNVYIQGVIEIFLSYLTDCRHPPTSLRCGTCQVI